MNTSKSGMLKYAVRIFAIMILSGVFASSEVTAQGSGGEIMVVPTRLVLKDNDRTAEVNLINNSNKRLTYRIDFINLKMEPDGSVKTIETPEDGAPFADSILRVTPRQLVLEPNQTQVVRLQVRRSLGTISGEYRSHLRFQNIPEQSTEAGDTANAEGISIKLIPIYGISIPVILRGKDTQAKGEFKNVSFKQDSTGANVFFDVTRTGNRSLFGEVEVTWLREEEKPVKIGIIRNFAVYPPIDHRSGRIKLQIPEGFKSGEGQFRLVFKDGESPELPLITETSVPAVIK